MKGTTYHAKGSYIKRSNDDTSPPDQHFLVLILEFYLFSQPHFFTRMPDTGLLGDTQRKTIEKHLSFFKMPNMVVKSQRKTIRVWTTRRRGRKALEERQLESCCSLGIAARVSQDVDFHDVDVDPPCAGKLSRKGRMKMVDNRCAYADE